MCADFRLLILWVLITETDDSKEGVEKKLRLVQALPRSRAKRLLNTWPHPASLMLRAREHALNVLSGVQAARPKGHSHTRRIHASRGTYILNFHLEFTVLLYSEGLSTCSLSTKVQMTMLDARRENNL